jgi:hypothetical protein
MYYRLSQEFRAPSTGKLLDLMFEDMESTARMVDDKKRLKAICAEGMESVCRRLFR